MSLEQFAGLRAALAEQLPLGEILEQEHLEETALRASEPIWIERIAGSIATQLEYTEKLRIAEDTLARTLSPVSDDEAAWVGLLGTLATCSDQSALLSKLGISLTDVGRLGRVWKRRMEADAELAPRLAKLAETPTAPERITAGRVELRPFPWSPRTKRPAAAAPAAVLAHVEATSSASGDAPVVQRVLASFQREAVAPAPVAPAPVPPASEEPSFDAWTIEHYAALARGLRANPTDADAVMLRAGLLTPDSRRLVHQHFQRRFQSEPGLRATFDALLATASPASPSPPARRASKDPLGGTEEMDTAQVRKAALPFEKNAAAQPPPAVIRPPRDPFGATVAQPADPPKQVPVAQPPAEPIEQAPRSERRRVRKTIEGLLSKHSAEDAATIARIKDQFTRKPDPFAGTANMPVVKPVPPSAALPFAPGDPRAKPPATSAAPQKQSGKTIASEAPLGWTLDRYAALQARLHASGQSEAEVLAALALSGAAKQLLDSYWQPLIRDDAKIRAESQALIHKHIASQRRR